MSQPVQRLLAGLARLGRPELSLRRQLLLWLLLPQLVLWIAGGVATYQLAAGYARRAIDASLSQASHTLARQVKPMGDGLLIDFPRAAQDVLEADPKDRLLYTVSTPPGQFILGNNRLPAPPPIASPRLDDPYFYDGELAPLPGASAHQVPLRLRVAALYLAYGERGSPQQTMLVQVARSSANREELARAIAVDTLLPLSALMLLMTMIVWAGIRAGLAPLERLRREVEARAPDDLTPLQLDTAPVELRSLARALNQLLASVQHSVVTQRRFISDAAHQLRTPLAGLKSQTELALQANRDEEQRARLQRVQQSAARSAHLVNQLLTLARAEPESALAQERSPLELRRFVHDLTAELVPRALRAGVDLGVDGGVGEAPPDDAPPIVVHANALLLREALSNLIDNALQYAGHGAVVTVRVASEAGRALVDVEDNGPGIDEADRARVFERFVRATAHGNGCGLGLPIVKEIIERHQGLVELQALQPQGLRVRLHLPLAAPGAPGEPLPRAV